MCILRPLCVLVQPYAPVICTWCSAVWRPSCHILHALHATQDNPAMLPTEAKHILLHTALRTPPPLCICCVVQTIRKQTELSMKGCPKPDFSGRCRRVSLCRRRQKCRNMCSNSIKSVNERMFAILLKILETVVSQILAPKCINALSICLQTCPPKQKSKIAVYVHVLEKTGFRRRKIFMHSAGCSFYCRLQTVQAVCNLFRGTENGARSRVRCPHAVYAAFS